MHHVHPAYLPCGQVREAITELDDQLAETQNRVGGLEESVAMLDIEAALADAALDAQRVVPPPDLDTLAAGF